MKRRLTALIGKYRYSIPLAMLLLAGLVGAALWGAARAASGPVTISVASAPGDPYSGISDGTGKAVLTYGHFGCAAVDGDGYCTGGVWPTISGAHWIWVTQQTVDSQVNVPVTFTKTFTLGTSGAQITAGSIQITADNHFDLSVNGTPIGSGDLGIPVSFDIHSSLRGGQNVIQVVATNGCCGSGFGNPAGIIFHADITYIPDSTAPTTTATLSGVLGSNSWYSGPVMLSLQATDPDDDASGLSTSYSTDGGATWQAYQTSVQFANDGKYSVLYRSTDPAGNQETAPPPATFNIDQTPPTLNVSGPPTGTSFDFCAGTQPTRPSFAPADSLSGLDGTQGDSWTVPTSANGAGTYTYAAHATDVAGNLASETRTYGVQYGAAFGGMLPPLAPSATHAFNLGSTIPVKFQLLCNGTSVANAAASLTVQLVGSADAPGAAIASSSANTGNAFTYDSTAQQYTFTLSTKSGYVGADGKTHAYTAGTWTLTIRLDDGTTRSCTIQLA